MSDRILRVIELLIFGSSDDLEQVILLLQMEQQGW